jgi:two-component system, NarL family, nitrate/nitrite response regulator NarL
MMAGTGATGLLGALARAFDADRVLVWGRDDGGRLLVRARFDAGAAEPVAAGRLTGERLEAQDAIAALTFHVAPGRGGRAGRSPADDGRLSERELQVLQLAADGHDGPAIAARLFVSPATVKTHFKHIYEKLGVGDRAAAVAHALRAGLIA